MTDKDDKQANLGKQAFGQVRHDDRGNAVWHWAADTARSAIASTSQLMRKLDVSNLSLESDRTQEDTEEDMPANQPKASPVAPKAATKAETKGGTKSFDPYSSTAGTAKPKSVARTAATPAVPIRRPSASQPRRSWWQRLLRRD